jgi:hypothetical protein
VKDDLLNVNWTRGLMMQFVQQMVKFVELWDLAHDFQLVEQDDTIY